MNPISLLLQRLMPRTTAIPMQEVPSGTNALDPEVLKQLSISGLTDATMRLVIDKSLEIDQQRVPFYRECEKASAHPIVAAAIELYADYATAFNRNANATIWATSKSKSYQDALDDLFETVNFEERVFDWGVQTTKLGDHFVKIETEPGVGVVSITDDIHPGDIGRLENRGVLLGFYERVASGTESRQILPPWAYVHFRCLGAKKNRLLNCGSLSVTYNSNPTQTAFQGLSTNIYGMSLIGNAIPVYKRLRLVEDSLLMSRLSKGVLRYLYKVSVKSTNPEAVKNLIDSYKVLLKRARSIDPRRGSESLTESVDLTDALTDLVIPVFGDNTNDLKVEPLGGQTDIKWIEDVKELRDQLACALRAPLSLLGGYGDEQPSSIGRSSAELQDVRFSRAARRVQRALLGGVNRICQIHMACRGLDPDPSNWELFMGESVTEEEVASSNAMKEVIQNARDMNSLFDELGVGVDKKRLSEYLLTQLVRLPGMSAKDLISQEAPTVPPVQTPTGAPGEPPAPTSAPAMESVRAREARRKCIECADYRAACPGGGGSEKVTRLTESLSVKEVGVKEGES